MSLTENISINLCILIESVSLSSLFRSALWLDFPMRKLTISFSYTSKDMWCTLVYLYCKRTYQPVLLCHNGSV